MQLPYLPNTDNEREAMLRKIGVSSVDELFRDVPERFLNVPFEIPTPLSEMELKRELKRMADANANTDDFVCFLGAGYYHHFVPGVVSHITGRSEFYTAYTPYQAEVSQGTLQSTYEYQSLICHLTDMEISNAGMYDGSTAATEAALMACRVQKKSRIAVLTSVNSRYISVMETYLRNHQSSITMMGPSLEGLSADHACLVVQQPNFLGYFEDLQFYSEKAHGLGVLLVVIFDPIAMGMFKSPGEYRADIAVAEGQPLGSPMSFGGPGLGIFTCRKDYLRQIPGRVVGKTTDTEGKTGYVLTLATREQHIRRERATSNICTNEALVALAATVYLAALGKRGLRQIAELCYHKAHYAAKLISEIDGYSIDSSKPFFKEFVVSCPRPVGEINELLLEHHIIGGLDVSHLIGNGMLLCVTEMNSRQEIENLVRILERMGR